MMLFAAGWWWYVVGDDMGDATGRGVARFGVDMVDMDARS